MEQFLKIATVPDNIPIVGLLFIVLICLYVALKQAFRHDKLMADGRKDDAYDEMIR